MGMSVIQANDYITNIGLDKTVWTGCQECGSCNDKKVKCRKGQYELQLYYSRGKYNLFNGGKAVKGGLISNIVNDLCDL
jgi:hypothetical protein